MPELPEVEVTVRKLKAQLLQRKILKIEIFYESVIQNIDFFSRILNQFIIDIQRKGKFLLFFCSNDLVLVGHLRMEGKIYIQEATSYLEKHPHEHFRLYLDRQLLFRYYDFRKFGRFCLYQQSNYLTASKLELLGLDPFQMSGDVFYDKLRKSRSIAIKKVLLNQRIISGIGNIYANEILFLVKIHPETPVSSLNLTQAYLLIEKARTVLSQAIIDGGTSISSFEALGTRGTFQNKLLVYNKKGANCCVCQQFIIKKIIGGRSSYFCPQCQKIRS